MSNDPLSPELRFCRIAAALFPIELILMVIILGAFVAAGYFLGGLGQ